VLLATYTLWLRDVVRFFRQRSRIVGALGTPLVFWLLLGSGLGQSFRPETGQPLQGGYLEFFFPGALALIVLFTAIFSTISLIEDRHSGFLQGVLVAPVPRTAIVLGKLLGGTTLAVLQAAVFLLLAPLAQVPLSLAALPALVGILVLMAFSLTGLGFLFAWWLDSTQGFHAIMNLVLMPMWILSGAVFPVSGAAAWIRGLMAVNPLTYGVSALRSTLAAGYDAPEQAATLIGAGPALPVSILVMSLFAGSVLVAGTVAVGWRR
jgi:ABC-2 type transport system permease protein